MAAFLAWAEPVGHPMMLLALGPQPLLQIPAAVALVANLSVTLAQTQDRAAAVAVQVDAWMQ